MIKAGTKGLQKTTVTNENSAAAMGSGLLPVFATPAMIALMEQTASRSIQDQLDEGQGTVGTKINISHLFATPIGLEVTCESELIEVDRRRLVFQVKACDPTGLIGEGTHERFIINNDAFMEKAKQKLS